MPPISKQSMILAHDVPDQIDGQMDSSSSLTIDCNPSPFGHQNQLCYVPANIWSDIEVPDQLELGQSGVYPGLGVWARTDIPTGTKFPPLPSITVNTVKDDPDDTNKVSVCFFYICLAQYDWWALCLLIFSPSIRPSQSVQ